MRTTVPALKLRIYAGRENGLIVIGTPESLSELGRRLQEVAPISENNPGSWPVEVASPKTEGPYSDVSEFKLSFHVEPAVGIPESLRPHRRNLSPFAFLVVGGLAVLGGITLFKWATHAI